MSESEKLNHGGLPWISLMVAGVLVALVVVLFLWQPAEEPKVTPVEPVTAPIVATEPVTPPVTVEPETQLPEPDAEDVADAIPEPAPAQLDISDSSILDNIRQSTNSALQSSLATLLVNDDLVNRFVVFTDNAANQELANKHRLMARPEGKFEVYQQAQRTWIDAQSYKRYDPYVAMLDGMNDQQLLALYHKYLPAIQEKYDEVGSKQQPFTSVLQQAIDHVLATPEVPTPVEVKTDSVMYEYVDPRIEALSPVQKQLLRMGPENMRRVKAKLRQLRELLKQQE